MNQVSPSPQTRAEWNGPLYQAFRAQLLGDAPTKPRPSCGLRWSL